MAGAIASARAADARVEVIVSDGGSRDATRHVAAAAGAAVLKGPRGRGIQLDAGARRASGDWFVFLHADTRLEVGWAKALAALPGDVIGGAFRFAVDSPRRGYRPLEAAVALRCRLLRLPYGDQALFCRGAVYHEVGSSAPAPDGRPGLRAAPPWGRSSGLPARARNHEQPPLGAPRPSGRHPPQRLVAGSLRPRLASRSPGPPVLRSAPPSPVYARPVGRSRASPISGPRRGVGIPCPRRPGRGSSRSRGPTTAA